MTKPPQPEKFSRVMCAVVYAEFYDSANKIMAKCYHPENQNSFGMPAQAEWILEYRDHVEAFNEKGQKIDNYKKPAKEARRTVKSDLIWEVDHHNEPTARYRYETPSP
jgi:hypothetical protein